MLIICMIFENYKNNGIKLTDRNGKNHLFFNNSKYIVRTEIDTSLIRINNIYNTDVVHIYGTINEYKKYYLNVTNLDKKLKQE